MRSEQGKGREAVGRPEVGRLCVLFYFNISNNVTNVYHHSIKTNWVAKFVEVPGAVYHLMNLVNKQLEVQISQRSFFINVLNTSGLFRDGDVQDIYVFVLLHTKCILWCTLLFSLKRITLDLYYSWNKTAVHYPAWLHV